MGVKNHGRDKVQKDVIAVCTHTLERGGEGEGGRESERERETERGRERERFSNNLINQTVVHVHVYMYIPLQHLRLPVGRDTQGTFSLLPSPYSHRTPPVEDQSISIIPLEPLQSIQQPHQS